MIEPLFNFLAIFYAFRGLQLAAHVARNWKHLKGEAFPPQNKRLAEQASFFLAVPISVLFHEGAHALAVLGFGGQVAEFGYRVFWGFVVPDGRFTGSQFWFIALAGTLGSLLFGFLAWITLRGNRSPTFGYFGLQAFRYQLQFSLIYYPLFTVMGFYGDWRTIYDFQTTPILSGLTAAGHATLLGMTFLAERQGFFQAASYRSTEDRSRFKGLEDQANLDPENAAIQLELIQGYIKGGLTNQANTRLADFLRSHPDSGEGHLQLAILQSQGKNRVPAKAKDSAELALRFGLPDADSVAQANQIVGLYYLGMEKVEESIGYFDQGIAAAKRGGSDALKGRLIYLRAIARRREGRYEMAYQDILTAISLAEKAGDDGSVTVYRLELETIQHHTGRSLPY